MSDLPTYIIIVVLVILKLVIWICIFQYRSKRRAMARCQRGIIVIRNDGTHNPDTIRDRDMILPNENIPPPYGGGIDNPQVVVQAPPSYDDIIKQGNIDTKPPSYEQVIGENPSTAPGISSQRST